MEILLPPLADSDRNIHLGVKHVLRFELLHQAVGDEFVVAGGLQVLSKCLERHEESKEILVLVERFGLGKSARLAMSLAQFDEGGRRDRAFQVKVKLGLGKGADERG